MNAKIKFGLDGNNGPQELKQGTQVMRKVTGGRRVEHGQSEEIAKRQQTRVTLEDGRTGEDLVDNFTGQGTT